MRDRELWQQELVDELATHFDGSSARASATKLIEVELALYLMEQVLPDRPARDGWVLLGGYPFTRAVGAATSDKHRKMILVARHLLWPLRRRRTWLLALETYRQAPERLRGYLQDDDMQAPAHREVSIAHDRWAVYAETLAAPPPFATRTLPLADPGPWRFLEGRNWSSVTVPTELAPIVPKQHALQAAMPGAGEKRIVPWDDLVDTAVWMDDELQRLDLPGARWERSFRRIRPFARNDDDTGFLESEEFTLDGVIHLVGMVGAGKSTLRDVLAVWAARNNLRSTLVVGDVAEALHLVELFTSLGLAAAPIVGATTRERHTQRMHRRVANQGASSLLAHDDPAFDFLSTACPLDALRGVEAAEPLAFRQAPCSALFPVDQRATTRRLSPLAPDGADDSRPRNHRQRHGCPLWAQCPRHHGARELVDADIWVATPAGLVHSAVPAHQNEERIRYLELACRRSDLIVVDEADRVQMQLDTMFAPATTLVGRSPNSWLDEVHQHKIEELARSGRVQLSNSEVMRWTVSVHSVTAATDRIYEMLLKHADLRKWVEADYFSAWTLQYKLIADWFGGENAETGVDAADAPDRPDDTWDDGHTDESPPNDLPEEPAQSSPDRRREVTEILDAFRDDPLGERDDHRAEVAVLIGLTRRLLHALGTTRPRRTVREQLIALSGRPDPATTEYANTRERRADEEQLAHETLRFEFTLLLAVLQSRLDLMTEMWPRVEAALNLSTSSNVLSRRPPEDYRPLVPESPMGNILGFQFQSEDRSAKELSSGELRFFRCAGAGRELLLQLPQLTAADGLTPPHVVLMSGTSWAGTSTRYHVLAPVKALLLPPQEELDAINNSTFSVKFLQGKDDKPLKLSGTKPELRPVVLEQMLGKLARRSPDGKPSTFEQELAAISDDRRKRLLVLTGSYVEARRAADFLDTIPRWEGKVCRLISDDAEQEHLWQAQSSGQNMVPTVLRRGDVATFAESGAEILVAPLLAIERGHNILFDGVAAIGSVFFLARPHPRPDDIGLAIQAVNDWAARMVRDGTFDRLVNAQPGLDSAGVEFRGQARARWRHLLNRQLSWRQLSPTEKISFTWDQLVVIWQVIGRLVRGGVPARVVFVDAPFAERTAAGKPGETWRTSLLLAIRHVLHPYISDEPDAVIPGTDQPIDDIDKKLVRTLYEPLYRAIDRIFPEAHG